MLDLISRGAQGHGPVHLLLTSVVELGFAWDGFPPSSSYDDWPCAALLLCYSGCLALSGIFYAF